MRRLATIMSGVVVTSAAAVALSQMKDAGGAGKSAEPGVESLGWLAGAWVCDKAGERIEETWSPPSRGTIMGMCRIDQPGGRTLYEMMLIEADAGDTVMWLMHYTARLKPKHAEAMGFKLVKSADREAVFEHPTNDFPKRIVYQQQSPDAMTIRLEGEVRGKPAAEELAMKRVRR